MRPPPMPRRLTDGEQSMMRPITYLACPYRHADRAVRVYRFEMACKTAGELMLKGHVVFSPISQCHPIAMAVELPSTWEFWQRIDRPFLERCSLLVVLCLDGWKESVGVADEIAIAKELGIPIDYMIPLGSNLS